MDLQALIDGGTHVPCQCGALLLRNPGAACRHCHAPQPAPAAGNRGRGGRAKGAGIGRDREPQRIGGLAHRRGHVLRLVAYGQPRPQGSSRAIAAGVVAPASKHLHTWRDAVTRAALIAAGGRWQTVDGAVRIEACFTLAPPKGHHTWQQPVFVTVPPDCDKLLRAIQDALAPRVSPADKTRSNAAARRFRLLADDALAVDSRAAKTYPPPWNTHPWALATPGVVVQLSATTADAAGMPLTSPNPDAPPRWLTALIRDPAAARAGQTTRTGASLS